jgi:hypothetical protein
VKVFIVAQDVPHTLRRTRRGTRRRTRRRTWRRTRRRARSATLRRAAAGEGAKRDEVFSPVTCKVLFGARRRARARSATRFSARRRAEFSSARGGGRGRGGDVFLGAFWRRRRRGGLQLYQLRAAWGATGQLSGICASGGAAQSASMFIGGKGRVDRCPGASARADAARRAPL